MERKLKLIGWLVAGVLGVSPMMADARPGHANHGVRDHGQGIGHGKVHRVRDHGRWIGHGKGHGVRDHGHGIGRGKGQGWAHWSKIAEWLHSLKARQVDEIIDDFCEDVEEDAQDLIDTGEDIADDLIDATADHAQCLARARDVEDELDCAERLTEEVVDAAEEAANGCADFAEDFAGDIERALRDAEDEGAVDEFLSDPRVTEKLLFGVNTTAQCAAALN